MRKQALSIVKSSIDQIVMVLNRLLGIPVARVVRQFAALIVSSLTRIIITMSVKIKLFITRGIAQ